MNVVVLREKKKNDMRVTKVPLNTLRTKNKNLGYRLHNMYGKNEDDHDHLIKSKSFAWIISYFLRKYVLVKNVLIIYHHERVYRKKLLENQCE